MDDLIAYLGSIEKAVKFPAARHANAERGSALYHEKGCVACHAPTPDFHPPHGDGAASPFVVAHPDLREKTSLEALTHFLAQPSTYRTDGRMPHFVLDAQESLDIASHLLDYQGSDPREAPKVKRWPKTGATQIERGKAIFTARKCASCHEVKGEKPSPVVALSGSPTDGAHCLSADPSPGLPRYPLDEGQRASLLAFVAAGKGVKDEGGHLTLAAMNCYACHDRNALGGPTPETNPFFVGDEALGDSGRLPPPLTGIGHKLRQDWLEGVLSGAEGSRVRPYVKTQMPIYPSQAKELAAWLAKTDGLAKTPPLVERAEDVEAGRKLLGVVGGVNCITCHTWEGKRSLGIQSVDIASLDKRLRPDWFRDYLLNPATYRPGTLMPPLWPGGHSTVPDVLGGDTNRQIAAIWSFIREGEGLPEGFPDRASGQFEIVPTDRPVIQRTFFEGAGSKAILVGFPGGISLAYDGAAARPAMVWRGRFFDAYNTWFSRHAPYEQALGGDVVAFPEAGKETGRRFRGYRLDPAGNPTFLFTEGEREVAEGYAVVEGRVVRTLTWTQGDAPEASHPPSLAVEEKVGERSLTFIYSWK